ncbi:adhesion G protein-coupled receptor L4-like [Formica exsecta]|uniref:adhesion G protein-coupled receptor L4-like n=1 Tax=Formica exsecta TaxID=72781 RepID=UPI001141F374|nr:adhesion G protein-coupled receptor L4-like [Formica exsecta]
MVFAKLCNSLVFFDLLLETNLLMISSTMQSVVSIPFLFIIFAVISGINTYDGCSYVTCGTNQKCKMYNNNPICWCKDGYKMDSYTKLCVEDQTGCNGVTCGTNEECKMYNNNPTCWCKEGYKRNPYMACVKDKPRGCDGIICGTNEECKMYNNNPTCWCKKGYKRNSYNACVKDETERDLVAFFWLCNLRKELGVPIKVA